MARQDEHPKPEANDDEKERAAAKKRLAGCTCRWANGARVPVSECPVENHGNY